MIKKVIFICSIISLLSFVTLTNFQELVVQKLNNYTENEFPEKIYIDTDKPYYTAGNDIWFTTYLLNGVTHKKSTKSNVVYVELINEKDSIVAQRKLHINDVSAAGDFKTDVDWDSGNYLLRGYTNYMRNDNPDYFFKKEIPIWNLQDDKALKSIDSKKTSTEVKEVKKDRPDIQFYPEGGYLVEGIPGKIAIKIKDKAFENISGVVKDSDNKTISAFKTFKFGLGSLIITPEAGKEYYACIQINGKEEKYKLPKVLPEGFSLNLLNHGSEIVFKIASSTEIGLLNSFIVVHQRGKIIFQKLIEASKNKLTVKLSTEALSSGVAHATLFNNAGKPVCDRLVFIQNPDNEVVLNVEKSKDIPTVRDKVTLELDLKDKIGNPLSGNLSLSVNDLQSIQKSHKDDTIETYLLLNSDLRGQIENPGFFFEKKGDREREFLLDLVMLTHGWSRFKWQDILYSPLKAENHFKTEKGLYISGQTQALKDRSKFISAPTRLTLIKETPPFQELKKSNENGQFKFGPYVFHDSVPVIIEARVKEFKSEYSKNKNVHISVRRNIYKSPLIKRELLLKNDTKIEVAKNYIEQAQEVFKIDTAYANNSQRLKEIVIQAKKERDIEIRNKQLKAITSYGSPSRRVDVNSIPGGESLTLPSLLQRLPGVLATNNSVTVRGGTPRVFLDDFEVEYDDVSTLSGSDVEFVDLLTGANASFFSGSANGIIVIYSKLNTGDVINTSPVPGIISFDYEGFYTAREFYSPDYSDSFTNITKNDIRTTLHWEPTISIKSDSKTEVTFYTSDIKSDYAIEIEGVTNSGTPVYEYSTFSVE